MALEKQTRFDGVSLVMDWPEAPKATTVAGKEVIAKTDFDAWLRDLARALQNNFDATAHEIESLKSAAK